MFGRTDMRQEVVRAAIAAFMAISGARGAAEDDWFTGVKAAEVAAADIAEERFRFLGRCGFACTVPAVGTMTRERCFPTTRVEVIGPTGDVIRDSKELALHSDADRFASDYNAHIRRELERIGKSQCESGEDWDAALYALGNFAMELPEGSKGQTGDAGGFPVDDPLGRDFAVMLTENNWKEDVCAGICRVLVESNMESRLVVAVQRARTYEPVREAEVVCEGGMLLSFSER